MIKKKKTWKELNTIFQESASAQFSEEEKKSKRTVLDMYKRAQIKCKINKSASALDWYRRADIYLQKKNFNVKQKNYINITRYPNIAYIYYSLEDYENALYYINKSISCLSEVGKEFNIINFSKIRQVHNIIRIFHKQKRYDEYFDWNLYLMNFFIFSEIPNTNNKVDLPVDLIPFVPQEVFTKQFNGAFLELIVNLNTNDEIPYEKICFFDSFIKRKSEIDQEKFKIFHCFINVLNSINNEVKDETESIVDKLFTSNDDPDYLLVKILLYVHEIRKHNQLKNNKDIIRIEHIQKKIQIAIDRIENKNKKHLESIKLKLFKNGILRPPNKSEHTNKLNSAEKEQSLKIATSV